MAEYYQAADGASLFEAQSWGSFEGRLLSVGTRHFSLLNPDGTTTVYRGRHLKWDSETHQFSAGSVNDIQHLDASGMAIDGISGLNIHASVLGQLLSADPAGGNAGDLARLLLRGADTLHADEAGSRLSGWGGNDILYGGNGRDVLIGGAGYDQAQGGLGNDLLIGQAGPDTLDGGGGDDRIYGGAGNDFLIGEDGSDKLFGGKGDDTIDGGPGRDMIVGGPGNDLIYGASDPDVIIYDFAWEDLKVHYDGSDYSIWVEAPDGTDHVFSALTFASLTGTYRFDVPTQSWVFVSANTGQDWLEGLWT